MKIPPKKIPFLFIPQLPKEVAISSVLNSEENILKYFLSLIDSLRDIISYPSDESEKELRSLLGNQKFKETISSQNASDEKYRFSYLIVLAEIALEDRQKLKGIRVKLNNCLWQIAKEVALEGKPLPSQKTKNMVKIYLEFIFECYIKNAGGQHVIVKDIPTPRSITEIIKTPKTPVCGLYAIVKPIQERLNIYAQKYGISFDDVAVVGYIKFFTATTNELYISRMDSYFPYPSYKSVGIGTLLMNRACELAIQLSFPIRLTAEKNKQTNNNSIPFYIIFFQKKYNLTEAQSEKIIGDGSYAGGGDWLYEIKVSLAQLQGNWEIPKKELQFDPSKNKGMLIFSTDTPKTSYVEGNPPPRPSLVRDQKIQWNNNFTLITARDAAVSTARLCNYRTEHKDEPRSPINFSGPGSSIT